jgi:hypothetical protein
MTVFADDTVTKKEKRELMPYIPVMYFLSLIMNVVQLWAFIMSLVRIKSISNRKDGYAWKSPVRTGNHLTQ